MPQSDLAKLYRSIRTAERARVIEHLYRHTPRQDIYDDPFLVRTHAFLRSIDEVMRADRLRHVGGMVARMEGKDLPRAWHPTEGQMTLPGFGDSPAVIGQQSVYSSEDDLIANKVLRTEVAMKGFSLASGIIRNLPLIDADRAAVETVLDDLAQLLMQA